MPVSDFPVGQGFTNQQPLQHQQQPWQGAMPGMPGQYGQPQGFPMGQVPMNGPQMGQMPTMGGPLGAGPPQMPQGGGLQQRPGMGLLGMPPMAGQPQQSYGNVNPMAGALNRPMAR